MSLAKRERLCALSNTLQLSIVEDDAYGLLNFPVTDKGDAQSIISASSQRPIRSFGGAESIIYVGSGSKILAPGTNAYNLVIPAVAILFVSLLNYN